MSVPTTSGVSESPVNTNNAIKIYSAWFCPYAQRVWMTLEHYGIPHEYIEGMVVNDDQSPGQFGITKLKRLLELNPKGQVPTMELSSGVVDLLRHTHTHDPMMNKIVQRSAGPEEAITHVLTESIECMKFIHAVAVREQQLQSSSEGETQTQSESFQNLIPDETLLEDAIRYDQEICSSYYKILMSNKSMETQRDAIAHFIQHLKEFVSYIVPQNSGYYKSQTSPTIVDLTVVPWILRLFVLEHFCPQFNLSEYDDDLAKALTSYLDRMKQLHPVKKTLWYNHGKTDHDLLDVYGMYANKG